MTSFLNKIIILFILLSFTPIVNSQNVKCYQLIRKQKNGVSDKNVKGWLYITFVGNTCYESDKNGVGINHGTMQRNDGYSNSSITVYDGSSYWGKRTAFKFNSDKSALNVVFDDGEIFVYKRATPPTGVTTCSLIRKRSSSSGGGNPSTPTFVPMPVPQSSQQSAQQQGDSRGPQYVEKTYPCSYCHGKGTVWENSSSVPNFGQKYCAECGRTVPGNHVHIPCPVCHGKGVETKMERAY